jgi:hypothetical protein
MFHVSRRLVPHDRITHRRAAGWGFVSSLPGEVEARLWSEYESSAVNLFMANTCDEKLTHHSLRFASATTIPARISPHPIACRGPSTSPISRKRRPRAHPPSST